MIKHRPESTNTKIYKSSLKKLQDIATKLNKDRVQTLEIIIDRLHKSYKN
jgi:hypothetical protein